MNVVWTFQPIGRYDSPLLRDRDAALAHQFSGRCVDNRHRGAPGFRVEPTGGFGRADAFAGLAFGQQRKNGRFRAFCVIGRCRIDHRASPRHDEKRRPGKHRSAFPFTSAFADAISGSSRRRARLCRCARRSGRSAARRNGNKRRCRRDTGCDTHRAPIPDCRKRAARREGR